MRKNKVFSVEKYIASCYMSIFLSISKLDYKKLKQYFISDENIKLFWYKIINICNFK